MLNKEFFNGYSTEDLIDIKILINELIDDRVSVRPDRDVVELVLDVTSYFEDIKISDMISKTRERPISEARQIAIYLISRHTNYTRSYVGNIFNRDHATVCHAIKTVKQLRVSNKVFSDRFERISNRLARLLNEVKAA